MRSVDIGTWGQLLVYDTDDEPAAELQGADACWKGDDRRRPVVLKSLTGRMALAFVAVWPTDRPPPPEGDLTREDVEGVALCQLVRHRCAECGGEVVGLYLPDDFLEARKARHDWIEHCPHCRKPAWLARIRLLPMPASGSSRL